MRDRNIGQGWFLAIWIGVAAGAFDALAVFLHPTPAVCLLSSPFFYGAAAAVLFALALAVAGALPPLRSRRVRFGLGVVLGFFCFFFAAYFVTTSTAALFQRRPALFAGLAAAVTFGGAGFVGGWRLCRRNDGTRQTRATLGLPRHAITALLALVLLTYPTLAAVHLLRGGGHRVASDPPPRGLVLISLDAARGDRVSALGYSRPTTPAVDALVFAGTAFRRAYVQAPASAAGHACMLTGLPPLAHGVVQNAGVLDDAVLTLAERLRAVGFHTAAFLDNYYLDARFGFDQGFLTYINQYRAAHLRGWDPRHLVRGTALYHAYHRLAYRPGRQADDSINGALAWLRHRPDGDFFLFLHVMDPHSPYDPPPDLRERFYRADGPPVRDSEALRARMGKLAESEIAALRDLYDASIANADRKVGRLVAELKRLGLFETTLVVVTADHGEVLYEKEATFDHGLPWQGNLHVPLVFSRPGQVPTGLVSDDPVPTAAIVPTVLALLGVPYEEQRGAAQGGNTEAAQGGDGDAPFHAPLLGPGGLTAVPDSALVFTLTGVRSMDAAAAVGRRHKLVLRQDGSAAFYDLAADPTEQKDLWPAIDSSSAPTELIRESARMRHALVAWLERSEDGAVVSGRRSLDNADRETIRRLRTLGYVD